MYSLSSYSKLGVSILLFLIFPLFSFSQVDTNTLKQLELQVIELQKVISNLKGDSTFIIEQEKAEKQEEGELPEIEDTAWVTFNRVQLWPIYVSYGPDSPKERVANIHKRLGDLTLFQIVNLLDSVQISEAHHGYKVHGPDHVLFYVSNMDAAILKKDPKELAYEYRDMLRAEFEIKKVLGNNKDILWRIGMALVVLFVLYIVVRLINLGYKWLNRYLFKLKQGKEINKVSIKGFDIINAVQLKKLILYFTRALRLIIILIFSYLALLVIFGLFPWTKPFANELIGYIINPLKSFGRAFLDYIPNLISLVIILYIGRILGQFLTYISNEIAGGNLEIQGFYPEWAKPTLNIAKFALYVVILIFIFPLLPGSDSDIFKGVSVFVGILITMGSSSAVTNAVGGLVLTYMRPFKKGDRVKIDGIIGFVIEKSMLVTRIRTAKQEIITIPNSKVLSGNSINYSTSIQENDGIIVSNKVTIGYDVPWRKVHKALLEAANSINDVSKEPAPFVMQTGLQDFYVEYEINAYVKNVKTILGVQSQLNANIQDIFRDQGIEILSPHYQAERDGNEITIPKKERSEKHFKEETVEENTPELDAQIEEEKQQEKEQKKEQKKQDNQKPKDSSKGDQKDQNQSSKPSE